MSNAITSSTFLPWLQVPCILKNEDLKTLACQFRFPVLLDSDHSDTHAGHTIFSAEPDEAYVRQLSVDDKNSSALINETKQYAAQLKQQAIPNCYDELPFVCGLLGYCSYRFGETLHKLARQDSINFPDVFIGHYTWSYVFDHQQQMGWLTFSPECSQELRSQILNKLNQNQAGRQQSKADNRAFELSTLPWQKCQDHSSYASAFKTVQDYIHAGDCYQVNLTQRFECDLSDTNSEFSAIDFFLNKQNELQTPYSAFMSFSTDCNLLSFSPEQFIHIKDGVIESKPIKGTIANTADQSNIERLQTSLKNQAENVMIVDLLRNDLSKVCEVNSVHVPELFKIESFKNVHHLVSHIRGTLRNDISPMDAFLSCFPGGSITGAPKLRAMEIIRELEMYDRSAYCGSVFYWNDNGHFDSNILIRTVIQTGEKLYCWAGGGIVADSEPEDEYQESLTKVANLTGITE